MSLSTIPDLCLFAIFDHIQLSDLLFRVSLVCHRWHSLKPEACHRRRALTIVQDVEKMMKLEQVHNPYNFLINPQTGKSYRNLTRVRSSLQNCALIVSKLTQTNCERIVDLFQNVSQLSLYQQHVPINTIEQANFLLINWSSNLKTFIFKFNVFSLKDYRDFEQEERTEIKESQEKYFNSLITAINSLSKLEQLDLAFLNCKPLKLVVKMPSLSAPLNRIAFCGYPLEDAIEKSFFDSLKENETLKEVALSVFGFLSFQNSKNRHFNSLVTRIYVAEKLNSQTLNSFELFCKRFTSLTYLKITIVPNGDRFTMLSLVQPLSKLLNLIHLSLTIMEPERIIEADQCPVQLPKIKILKLSLLRALSHKCIEHLCILKIFPNVEVINLKCIYDMGRCNLCRNNFPETCKEQCQNLLLKSLNQDGKSPKIIWNRKYGNRYNIFDHEEL